MKKVISFNLAKRVAEYRNSFYNSVSHIKVPTVTEEMKADKQNALLTAKVVRELTESEYKRLDEVLLEAKNSTPY